jgi:hypothetical protein
VGEAQGWGYSHVGVLMANPKLATIVRPAANPDVVEALEGMLEEAKRGEFTSFIAFRLGELPRTVGTTVAGCPSEADVVLAIERWNVNHLRDRE